MQRVLLMHEKGLCYTTFLYTRARNDWLTNSLCAMSSRASGKRVSFADKDFFDDDYDNGDADYQPTTPSARKREVVASTHDELLSLALEGEQTLPLGHALKRIRRASSISSTASSSSRTFRETATTTTTTSSTPADAAAASNPVSLVDNEVLSVVHMFCQSNPAMRRRKHPLTAEESATAVYDIDPDISEEEKEQHLQSLRVWDFDHIARLLVQAVKRPSRVDKRLMVTPTACIRGESCHAMRGHIRGFVNSAGGDAGCILMSSMTPEELEAFETKGVAPRPFLCVLCLIQIANYAVEAITDKSMSLPRRVAFQSFQVPIDTEGGFDSRYCIRPSSTGELFNGIVAPFPRLMHDMMRAQKDAEGTWVIRIDAMRFQTISPTTADANTVRLIHSVQQQAQKTPTFTTTASAPLASRQTKRRRGGRGGATTHSASSSSSSSSHMSSDAYDPAEPRPLPPSLGESSTVEEFLQVQEDFQ